MELLRKRFALDLQTFAIITLVLGNLAQAFSDVLVKLIGPGFSPFQYMFLRQLLTLLVLLPFMLRVPRSAWGLGAWKWHLLRGHLCLLGGGGMMLALTQLPLATANAIFYVSPLLTLPLAEVQTRLLDGSLLDNGHLSCLLLGLMRLGRLRFGFPEGDLA